MNNPLLELYSDYLMSSFAQTTATGLARLLDGEFSHDQITRFLAGADYTSRDLWSLVKPVVRAIEAEDGVLIFDDTIEEKPYTDENEIIAWYFDHSQNRTVKGVNILNCLYSAGGVNIPVAFEIVHKDQWFCEVNTRQEKRQSALTKNELLRRMLRVCQQNQLCYRIAHKLSFLRSCQDTFIEYPASWKPPLRLSFPPTQSPGNAVQSAIPAPFSGIGVNVPRVPRPRKPWPSV